MILIVIIFCLHRSREESFVDYMLLERLDAVCLQSENTEAMLRMIQNCADRLWRVCWEDSRWALGEEVFIRGPVTSPLSWPCYFTTLMALLRYLRLASVTLARCRHAR